MTTATAPNTLTQIDIAIAAEQFKTAIELRDSLPVDSFFWEFTNSQAELEIPNGLTPKQLSFFNRLINLPLKGIQDIIEALSLPYAHERG